MPSPPLFDEFDGTNVGTYSNIIYLIKKKSSFPKLSIAAYNFCSKGTLRYISKYWFGAEGFLIQIIN